jgi:hypothetical protein
MATHRGGRQRPDKGPGRNHWAPRRAAIAAKIRSGQANNDLGKWIPTSKLKSGKIEQQYNKQGQHSLFNEGINRVARMRRGKYGGRKHHTA